MFAVTQADLRTTPRPDGAPLECDRLSGEKVLLLASRPERVHELESRLRALGHRVHFARNSKAAHRIVLEGEISLIVADQDLEEGSGLAALRELRGLRPNLRQILAVSRVNWELVTAARLAGIDGVLAPPPDTAEEEP